MKRQVCYVGDGQGDRLKTVKDRLKAVESSKKGFGIHECRGTISAICSGYIITKGMGSLSQIPRRHAVACPELLDGISHCGL